MNYNIIPIYALKKASPFEGVDALAVEIFPKKGQEGKGREREGMEEKGRGTGREGGGWPVGALIPSKGGAIYEA